MPVRPPLSLQISLFSTHTSLSPWCFSAQMSRSASVSLEHSRLMAAEHLGEVVVRRSSRTDFSPVALTRPLLATHTRRAVTTKVRIWRGSERGGRV